MTKFAKLFKYYATLCGMISKSEIKHIRSLRLKKNRIKTGEFVLEGEKLYEELLKSNFNVVKAFSTIPDHGVELISENELSKVSQLSTPNKVIATVQIPKRIYDLQEFSDDLILVLDGVKDPGNLGTLLRIADWFGIKNIVCSEDTVDVYNSKVVQATMGAVFRVNVHYLDLQHFLHGYKATFPQHAIYAADMEGDSVYTVTAQKGVLIMGSESHGLSDEIRALAQRITIPRVGEAESLNVAVAAGIICACLKKS